MKRWGTGAIVVLFALGLFIGGYFTGKANGDVASRVVQFGYPHAEQDNRTDYPVHITDVENQTEIDNVMMILMNAERVEIEEKDREPDLYLEVQSPKKYVGLVNARVWIENDQAMLNMSKEYFALSTDETAYLKKLAKYETYKYGVGDSK